jgi:NAD(P)-dependent dehydrogenase (short-subunit alcohol dehydrogenase family)
MDPKGKTALITGGAHRVGEAITLALAQGGANVVINYYASADAAQRTAAQARDLGVEALPVQADVSDHRQVEAMVRAAAERFGSIDILVNSASHFEKTPFPTQDVAAWGRVTRILIDGSFYCANAIAPMMLKSGEGTIVNILDSAAYQPWPGWAAHCVGKAGLAALTRQLALELAPGVRVNAVAPGPVLPPSGLPETRVNQLAQGTLLERWGTPQDVAGAVMYLVGADYVTGEVLVVDGGERFGHLKP